MLNPRPLFPLLSSKSMTVSVTGFLLLTVKFTVDPALKIVGRKKFNADSNRMYDIENR